MTDAPLLARYVGAYLLGSCANEAERDKGTRVHALRDGAWMALCSAQPGRRSAGWATHPDQLKPLADVTCPRCIKALGKLDGANQILTVSADSVGSASARPIIGV